MRTLESLRDTCIDGTPLQTAFNGSIVLATAGVGNSKTMQKTIGVNGFYHFFVTLYYSISSGSWVNGTDYLKIDVFTTDNSPTNAATSYNPIINTHYKQRENNMVFTGTIVLYCYAGHSYGLHAEGSKQGSVNVNLFETMRIF